MKNQLITGALTLTMLVGTATVAFAGTQTSLETKIADTAYAICTSATQLDMGNITKDIVVYENDRDADRMAEINKLLDDGIIIKDSVNESESLSIELAK